MNELVFFEIHVDQPQRAIAFYGSVFGWEFEPQAGLPIDYWLITGAGITGGLLQRPVPVPNGGTNAFLCTVAVPEFDRTAEAVAQAGGVVALPRFAVPGRGWQGYFLDPEGNTFGVLQLDAAAQ
jgi:predicted enzyme related to lactoylglutathione lyase